MEGQVETRLSVNELKGKGFTFLLEEFRKYGGDEKLVAELRSLTGTRNDIAHEAFYRFSQLKIDDDRI